MKQSNNATTTTSKNTTKSEVEPENVACTLRELGEDLRLLESAISDREVSRATLASFVMRAQGRLSVEADTLDALQERVNLLVMANEPIPFVPTTFDPGPDSEVANIRECLTEMVDLLGEFGDRVEPCDDAGRFVARAGVAVGDATMTLASIEKRLANQRNRILEREPEGRDLAGVECRLSMIRTHAELLEWALHGRFDEEEREVFLAPLHSLYQEVNAAKAKLALPTEAA